MSAQPLIAAASAGSRARICSTCAHGKHLLGPSSRARLGWTACAWQETSTYFPEGRECVNGQWRSAPQVSEAARSTAQASGGPADAESAWWNTTNF